MAIATGRMKGLPHIQVALVDVRDVALAHLKAVYVEAAANQRFILVSENMWF